MLGAFVGEEAANGGIEGIVVIDDHVVKIGNACNLFMSGMQTFPQGLFRFGAALSQAGDQFLLRLADEKDGDGGGQQLLDRLGALHVDAHHHILTGSKGLSHVSLGNALVLTIDPGVLQQLIVSDHPLEFGGRVKIIVSSMDLVVPWCPVGGGHDKMEGETPFLHPLDDRILAGARGTGNDDEQRRLLAVERICSGGTVLHHLCLSELQT